MHYLLEHVWNRRNVVIGHLLKHVPFVMHNNTDGDKEEMPIM